MSTRLEKRFQKLLEPADIQINGNRPWDVRVHDKRLYSRILRQGLLGLGEAYMDGWWDCDQLDVLVDRVFKADIEEELIENPGLLLSALVERLNISARMNLARQTRKQARDLGKKHYDIGNDLYQRMLDSRMNYTCAYWKNATNLDQAQENKLKLVCDKLKLEPGMRVLDIGCGWGSFAAYAAENYGVEVVGVTISQEQLSLGREMCEGLPVELRFQDYRDIDETFDRIVSLGMFEHVGQRYYKTYMQKVRDCLHDDGLFLMQTIGNNISTSHGDEFISTYIFPHGMIPSIKQIGDAAEKTLVMEDWQNFGHYYDKTLLAWYDNFNNHWSELKEKYGERFRRMWNFYLLICAGHFRSRGIYLWQIVFSKNGHPDVYQRVPDLELSELSPVEAGFY